jgi:dTDP-glucose 4,6-dehydratase
MAELATPSYRLPVEDLGHVLDRTAQAWEELRGRRIFITGGTGFFGTWLVESFLWANEKLGLDSQAVLLTRDPQAFARKSPHVASHPAIRCHAGDVRDFVFPPGTFSHVIHAAVDASARLNQQSPGLMFDTIVEGTRRTLDFAVACQAEKFLLTSSGAVYGGQPPELSHVSEEYAGAPDPLSPSSAYHEGKLAAEMLCALYHQRCGLPTKIARCFAFVGPYLPLDMHFAVGNFLRDALCGKAIEILGDGTPYRSYLYAADLAVWLWRMLFEAPACRAYNVGSDQAFSLLEVARAVAQLPSRPLEVHVAGACDPSRPASRYVPSIERARRELGLDVAIPLDVALRRTFVWHQNAGESPASQPLNRVG